MNNSGVGSWRAGCVGTRTSGSEVRAGETEGFKEPNAPRPDPYDQKTYRGYKIRGSPGAWIWQPPNPPPEDRTLE